MDGPWLLLGGSGYVGTHLAREFSRRGVPYVIRDAADADLTLWCPSTWIEAAGAVLLLAGRVRHQSPEVLLHENLSIPMRVVESYQAADRRPPLFFLSSLHVYTRSTGPVGLGSPTLPSRAFYGAVKLAAESVLADGAARTPFPLWIGRASNLVALEPPLNLASFVADMSRDLRERGCVRVHGDPVRDIVLLPSLAAGLLCRAGAPPAPGSVVIEDVCTGIPRHLAEVARAAAFTAGGGACFELAQAAAPDCLLGRPPFDRAWGAGPSVDELALLIAGHPPLAGNSFPS